MSVKRRLRCVCGHAKVRHEREYDRTGYRHEGHCNDCLCQRYSDHRLQFAQLANPLYLTA